MEDFGKHEENIDVIKAQLLHDLPTRAWYLRDGLMALLEVHKITNQCVKHGNTTLDKCILTEDVLRTYTLALMVEVGEFIQTLNWKPWRKIHKQPSDAQRIKVLDEFADILAFIGVLLTILDAYGFSVHDIANAYSRKERTNMERFVAEWNNEQP